MKLLTIRAILKQGNRSRFSAYIRGGLGKPGLKRVYSRFSSSVFFSS